MKLKEKQLINKMILKQQMENITKKLLGYII